MTHSTARATRARPAGWRTFQRVLARRDALVSSLGRSTLVQLMVAMTCVALAALLYLAQASQASVLQYNIDGLRAQSARLNARNAGLQATATGLRSLQRIEALATNQLHMTRPDISNTIWLRVPGLTVGGSTAPDAGSEMIAAQRRSQPLNWMERFLTFVKSSL